MRPSPYTALPCRSRGSRPSSASGWASRSRSSAFGPGVSMLIVMRHGATETEIAQVAATIAEMGYEARVMPGRQRTTVGVVGNDGRVDPARLAGLAGVQECIPVTKPYKQVSREWRAQPTIVQCAGGLTIGGDDVVIMAGPCSVESEKQILEAARAVRDAGATVL